MTLMESLAREFEREARSTRRLLERVPNDKLGWRPHEKSYTAGALASHIVDCIRWADEIFSRDEFDVDPAEFKSYRAESVADLLATFDQKVAAARRILASVPDAAMMQPWRFKVRGTLRFERQKAEVFRDFSLSHLIHHRGQLSVYLRLLNVAVPGAYGPSADEQF